MRTNRWSLIVALLLAALVVGGCAARAPSPARVVEVERVVTKVVEVEVAERGVAVLATPAPPSPRGAYGAAADMSKVGDVSERMLVRTVNMLIIVEDTDETLDELQAIAKTYNGYIADSRRWHDNDQPHATVTLRVPAESLDEVLDLIHGMAIKVQSEDSTGDDVTEEYTDAAARLRNLEATEEELLVLMTEVRENRGKAEDILAIHRELTSIRGQIESLKGRMQYLERMTALATLHIEIHPKEAPRSLVEEVPWEPLVTVSKALRALVDVFKWLVDKIIYLVIFSSLVLVPLGILWLLVQLVRFVRRRQERRKEESK